MAICRVEQETNAYLERQSLIDSIFDAGLLDIRCKVCKESKPNKDMAFVFDHIDEGCCKDCAEIDHVKSDLGFE
jgi:hypothetical protein